MEDAEYQAMFDVEQTHWWFVSRRMFFAKVFRRFKDRDTISPLRIADIGAGTGGMVPFLKQYGDVVAIEPNVIGRQLSKKRGIHVYPGTVEKTGLKRQSVDIVCILDVLYHEGILVTSALKEAKRILRPGGWLVISSCAMPFLAGPHDSATDGRERYTYSSLSRVVRNAGFTIDTWTYMYFFLFPVVATKRLIDRLFSHADSPSSDVLPAPWLINILCLGVNYLEAALLPVVRYPWGSSIFLMARKKEAR